MDIRLCYKKGEKVSTPLDKDGRDLHGLYNTYEAWSLLLRGPTPYFSLTLTPIKFNVL